MSCPICGKRNPARFCPAKGESICAVCCGSGREVTIDCVPDCPHLLAAYRYEEEHRRPFPPDLPLMDVDLRHDLHLTHAPFMTQILHVIAQFCVSHNSITDPEVLTALQALAETYRTLASGLYYERTPDGRTALELYRALSAALDELKGKLAEQQRYTSPKDSEIFQLLVLAYRYGLLHSNGRPRSSKFIEFLRSQFPDSEAVKRSESRIIVP